MLFSTKEDVGAPIEWVWSQITDFAAFEQLARERGATVQRMDAAPVATAGSGWKGRAKFRGKDRDVIAKIIGMAPPNTLNIEGNSNNFNLALEVELVALNPNRTRMRVAFEAKPSTLSARLIMQSARLARTSLTKRYKGRIAKFADTLDTRYRQRPAA